GGRLGGVRWVLGGGGGEGLGNPGGGPPAARPGTAALPPPPGEQQNCAAGPADSPPPGLRRGASGHPVSRSPGDSVTGTRPRLRAGLGHPSPSAGRLPRGLAVRGPVSGATAAGRLLSGGPVAPGGLIKCGYVPFRPAP